MPSMPAHSGGAESSADEHPVTDDFRDGRPETLHRLLGPRTAYLVGSVNADGSDHLCAASNVTNVGNTTQLVAVALWPEWTTTANIKRSGEFTLSLMSSEHIEALWIVGYRYTKVTIPPRMGKFAAAGLAPRRSRLVAPAGAEEALAILECRVDRILDDVGDHVLFIAEVLRGEARGSCFSANDVLDAARAHPAMQNSGNQFAEATVAPSPDTNWCSRLVQRRSALDCNVEAESSPPGRGE